MIEGAVAEELFRDIYPIIEHGSLIFALIYYNKYKNYPFYKYFIIYLLNILLFKIIDFFIGDGVSGEEGNFDLYNYYTFFEFNFIVLIYYSLIENKKNLIWIKLLAVSFNLIYFISFYLSFLNLYTVQIEGFFNSLLIIIYFIELLNSEMVLNYKKIFPFWMSVGFLLFYLTSIPFFTLLYSKIFDNRLMFVLLYSIIIVLHLIFIYGLVTCKKAEN